MLRGIVESHLPVLHSGGAPERPPGVIGRRPGRAEHGTRTYSKAIHRLISGGLDIKSRRCGAGSIGARWSRSKAWRN